MKKEEKNVKLIKEYVSEYENEEISYKEFVNRIIETIFDKEFLEEK